MKSSLISPADVPIMTLIVGKLNSKTLFSARSVIKRVGKEKSPLFPVTSMTLHVGSPKFPAFLVGSMKEIAGIKCSLTLSVT